MFLGQNGGDSSIFLKILKDFDDSLLNKTSECMEMCIFVFKTVYQVILVVFGSKSARKKTSLRRYHR